MKSFRTLATPLALTMLGCAGGPAESPQAAAIALGEDAAPGGYVELGKLEVTSGKGCGVFGEDGSRPDAERLMRQRALELNASYVRITDYRSPPPNHQCLEHEHRLSGIAYRAASSSAAPSASAPPPSASAPPAPASATSDVLQDYEGEAALGRPAPASPTSSVTLALAPGESSANALSVTYSCTGDDARASLDVWTEARARDWRNVGALSVRVKPDAALVLSVSFMDGHHTGYTEQSEPLTPGIWQVVTLPLNKFQHNPYGPPGDQPGAAVDVSHVSAFGFAPRGCASGHFLIDDFKLVR